MDDRELWMLTTLPMDSVNVSTLENEKYFKIQDTDSVFTQQESLNFETFRQSLSQKRMSLVERADSVRSRVPPVVTRATSVARTHYQTRLDSVGETKTEERKPRERKQTMKELIYQKRGSYIFQLGIDAKISKIKKLSQASVKAETELEEETRELAESVQNHKFLSTELEKSLAQARKAANLATEQRIQKQRVLAQKKANIYALNSSIDRFEEPLESYTEYRNFLVRLAGGNTNPLSVFKTPKQLLDIFEGLEKDCMFIVEICSRIRESSEHNNTLRDIIDQMKEMELEKMKSIVENQNKENLVVSNLFKTDVNFSPVENELKSLNEHIREAYTECIGGSPKLSSLEMLTQIEKEIETMNLVIEKISPAFLEEKTTCQEAIRREKQRAIKVEKTEQEYQRKIAQAIERARMPPKSMFKRPVVKRSLPKQYHRVDSSLIKTRTRMEEALNSMLFEDSN